LPQIVEQACIRLSSDETSQSSSIALHCSSLGCGAPKQRGPTAAVSGTSPGQVTRLPGWRIPSGTVGEQTQRPVAGAQAPSLSSLRRVGFALCART